MKGSFVIILIAVALVSFGMIFSGRGIEAQQQDASAAINDLSAKVDQLVQGQKEIMNMIEELKEEMRIVKIRVTQAQ